MTKTRVTTKRSHKVIGETRRDGASPAPKTSPHAKPTGLLSFFEELSPARTIFLVCVLSCLAYANSLGGDFVFDDNEQIVENQNVRSWDNLGKAFTTHVWAFRERAGTLNVPPPLPYYRPLFTVMLTAEYQMFGLWPQGWHLISLLLHILCAAGVFYVVLTMSGRNLVAAIASVVFAVHPVHAESVGWISGMTDPLFGVFFLASFYFYLKSRATSEQGPSHRRAFVMSLVMFAVSAFAKETALSLVLLVFVYELIEASSQQVNRFAKAAKRAAPYAAVALIYLVPRYLVLRELMWTNPQAPDRPLAYTLLTLPFVVCSYVSHLLWPIGLSVTYNTHFITSASSPRFLLPFGVISLIAAALFFYRKRVSREVWQVLALIFVPLLPVLNLGQVSREEYLIFDHYLYLSVAGLGYLVAIGIFKLGAFQTVAKLRTVDDRRPAAAIAVFGLITLAFTVAAARENKPWANSYSLWSNVARVRPAYWAAHYNAGLASLDGKRFAEARDVLTRSAELKPDEASVFDALGRAYGGLGDDSAAALNFKRAIEINPEMVESYNNLGTVYFKNEEYALAESNFSAALRLNPESSASRYNLGLCYAREGRYIEATRELERAIQAAPDDAEALYELGLAYERMGRAGDAVLAFERGRASAKSHELADRMSESLSRLRGEIRQP